jgi:hypothetical protein
MPRLVEAKAGGLSVTAVPARLPPLDPNAEDSADADLARRERYLRRRLAEGGYTPSRLRLLNQELREVVEKRKARAP